MCFRVGGGVNSQQGVPWGGGLNMVQDIFLSIKKDGIINTYHKYYPSFFSSVCTFHLFGTIIKYCRFIKEQATTKQGRFTYMYSRTVYMYVYKYV